MLQLSHWQFAYAPCPIIVSKSIPLVSIACYLLDFLCRYIDVFCSSHSFGSKLFAHLCSASPRLLVRMSASRRSRTRSRSPARHDGALDRMRSQLDFPHDTAPVEYAPFLRKWLQHLLARPVEHEGQQYFPLVKEHTSWPGHMWLRMEKPYSLRLRGNSYALDFSLWHGADLVNAVRQTLLRGSSNQARALTFCWPRAGRGQGRVVVSRMVGMSLLFDAQRWAQHGYGRFHQKLHVHHLDDIHENCFMNNLCVVLDADHIGDHNRRR